MGSSGHPPGGAGPHRPAALSLQFYDEAEARKYTQKYGGTSAAGLRGLSWGGHRGDPAGMGGWSWVLPGAVGALP